jgi:hypothetical protein
MNERIKELAEQAHGVADEIFDRQGKMYGEIVMEKFAGLIVKECYLWAKENGGLGCEEDFEALKEHLGVEE